MRLSIATKIFLTYACVIATFCGVIIFGLVRSQQLYEQIQALNRAVVPLSLLLSDAQNDLKSFDVALSDPDPQALGHTLQVARRAGATPRRLHGKLERARALSRASRFEALPPDEQRRLASVHARIVQLSEQAEALARRAQRLQGLLGRQPEADAEALTAERDTLRTDARRLDTTLARLRNDLRVSTELALWRASDRERANLYALILSSIAALLIALLMGALALAVVRPLGALGEAARRVAGGDYQPIEAPRPGWLGDDEVAVLTDEFNSMARALEARDRALHEQHAALLRSERLATVGRMTSLITHELRNPLSSIGLNAEMLHDALLDPLDDGPDALPERLAHLQTIIEEVDRLKDITEEYLVYARMPAPRMEPDDLGEVLEQLVDFHTFEWSQQGVEVLITPASPPEAPIHADGHQLRQALLNLLRNAVEASPDGGLVSVTMTRDADADTLRVDIDDDGPGVDPALAERIFEPFVTSKAHGTGLGLAMTLQIIEEHGGTLTCTPREPHGARFTLTLPASPPQDLSVLPPLSRRPGEG